jgi:pantoate--beta-alanine ligase
MTRVDTAGLRKATSALLQAGRRISLVPTMGALHDGHASLIRRSRAAGHATVTSVFVNPTQFGPNEDFGRYPRTHDADLELATRAGSDLVWFPTVADLYPNARVASDAAPTLGVAGSMHINAGPSAGELCGRSRPGLFDGVCTVVAKLFTLSRAHEAYFGEKDWQQLVIIRQMAREFHLDVQVHGAPILRDPDGLAMSSRNRYLKPEQRATALALHRTIELAQAEFAAGERSAQRLAQRLRASWAGEEAAAAGQLRLDYLELREPDSLAPSATLSASSRLILAAYLGEPVVRLIDNAALSPTHCAD